MIPLSAVFGCFVFAPVLSGTMPLYTRRVNLSSVFSKKICTNSKPCFCAISQQMPIVGLTMRFNGVFPVICYIYYNNVACACAYAHTRKNRITKPFVNVFNNSTTGKLCTTNQSVLVKPNIN